MVTIIQDDGGEVYETKGGIKVSRQRRAADYANAIDNYVESDTQRGAVSRQLRISGSVHPLGHGDHRPAARYFLLWSQDVDRGLQRPRRGTAVLHHREAEGDPDLTLGASTTRRLDLTINEPDRVFTEEERSKIPTVFTALRAIVDLFYSSADSAIGLFGAFGYDLAFQFDAIKLSLARPEDQRDMVLFLPDEILVVDHYSAKAWIDRYDFEKGGVTTDGKSSDIAPEPFKTTDTIPPKGDHRPGEYAELVVKAKESFRRGDLFEVVPGQKFMERCESKPSDISRRLKAINPSPYSFFINLGHQEYLVGASPEMFVRVSGRRIETCPISGTIKRGDDPIADSEQILKLLNSKKDESELTMCSDVDRNDKSRVCEPGSVKVIGRRQIEMYSRLIHTVDHIEGRLRDDMDAFDGFLSHAWAVTVTGAPKLWAMRFIESHEKSPRAWYGGAIGMVGFNGDMNTGLTLRTIRIKDGIAEVRAGATLLNDSNPQEEEAETELKASAMIAAIRDAKATNSASSKRDAAKVGHGVKILLVDHEDSFVHTLANYFRQTGATVSTVRTPVPAEVFDRFQPDLVVLSPGPGNPTDFDCKATIKAARAAICRSSVFALACRPWQKPMVVNFVSSLCQCTASRHVFAFWSRVWCSRSWQRGSLSAAITRSSLILLPCTVISSSRRKAKTARSWVSNTPRSQSQRSSSIRNRS